MVGSSSEITLALRPSSLRICSKGVSSASLATCSLSSIMNFSAKQSCMKSGCWSRRPQVGRVSGSIRRHWDRKSREVGLQPGKRVRSAPIPPPERRTKESLCIGPSRLALRSIRFLLKFSLLVRFTRFACLVHNPPVINSQF